MDRVSAPMEARVLLGCVGDFAFLRAVSLPQNGSWMNVSCLEQARGSRDGAALRYIGTQSTHF